MQILQDREYYAGRAAKARELAMAAADPGIRNIHLQMAKRYDGLAQSPSTASSEQRSQFPYDRLPEIR